MAIVRFNSGVIELSGRVGDFVFRRSPKGKTIVYTRPDMSNVQWSAAQKAHRQRFKEAVAYAKAAMGEPNARVHYEEQAASLHKRPYHLAVADYFKGRNLLKR